MKKMIECLESFVGKRGLPREYALDKFLDFLLDLFDYKWYNEGKWESHAKELGTQEPELMTAAMEWLNVTSDKIEAGGWYDTLGHLYEQMYQSKGKANALGQFYTPESICDLMATITEEENVDGTIRVNDCACGSGRTILAVYQKYKRGYYTGEDVDGTSVRMCALNLMVHGARGRAVCHDTLRNPVNFGWGFEINEVRYPYPTPYYSVRRISNPEPKEAEIVQNEPKNVPKEPKNVQEPGITSNNLKGPKKEISKPITETPEEKRKYKPGEQLSLF